MKVTRIYELKLHYAQFSESHLFGNKEDAEACIEETKREFLEHSLKWLYKGQCSVDSLVEERLGEVEHFITERELRFS